MFLGGKLFRRFVDRSGFAERLKRVFSIRCFDGDYGSFRVTLALIGMLMISGTRIRHLRNLERDPLLLRFARLQRLPTGRTVSNTLKETTRTRAGRGVGRGRVQDSASAAKKMRPRAVATDEVMRTSASKPTLWEASAITTIDPSSR